MIDKPLAIGIDLGGTKISTALVDSDGRTISRDYRETLASEGPEAVITRMLDAARQVMGEAGVQLSQVAAVGIGSPGPLDPITGVVIAPPNLPGWDHVPLRQQIEDGLEITAHLEHDAKAAALAEHRFGAGRGTSHMIYIVAGTGIGGGLILDGKLYHGAGGMAGEIGHTTILPNGPRCNCGNFGCLEALASGTAIARQARERIAQGLPTLMVDLTGGDPERVTAKLVAEAARQGDAEARKILSEAMNYLGVGIANLVNLFNPELIVIGAGLANLREALFEPVRRAIDCHAFRDMAQMVRVVPAELGEDAGVLGAAAVALTRVE